MATPIIEIENLTKRYRLGVKRESYLSLRDEMMKALSPTRRKALAAKGDFLALNNVSFSVNEGEAVGILGRNGAGKSTLLKVLSQITPPTEGRITMRGRVASLLEVGTGFHPELTGRENVFLNGAILGMTRKEIARKFDEIVEFSEVEKFLDTPVKRYSSGMYVRLAFAVAAHLEPEILIIDEVLAVGDASFQAKCLGKMDEVAKSGRTVFFVSHNVAAVEALCTKGVVLKQGQLMFQGDAHDAVEYYVKNDFLNEESLQTVRQTTDLTGTTQITKVTIRNESNEVVSTVRSGDKCHIDFAFSAPERPKDLQVAFTIRDHRLQYLIRPSTVDRGWDNGNCPEEGVARCTVPRLPLVPGRYRVTAHIYAGADRSDAVEFFLNVIPGVFFPTGRMADYSPVLMDHDWELLAGVTA